MATFITSTKISESIEQLVKNAEEFICLVSPYIDINDLLQDLLDEKSQRIPISIIYGKSKNKALENKFKNNSNYTILFNKNLHGKLYLSDKCAIVTSMNLYEYSQVNNIEFGILIEKDSDEETYDKIFEEIDFLKKRKTTNSIQIQKKDCSTFKDGNPYTMSNLYHELSKYKYNSNININHQEYDALYKAICKYAMTKHLFNAKELYKDHSYMCVYRHIAISENLYNEIKEYFLANKK